MIKTSPAQAENDRLTGDATTDPHRHQDQDMEGTAAACQKANVLILVDDFYSSHAGTEQHILFLLKKLPRTLLRVHFVVMSRIHHGDLRLFAVDPILLREQSRSGAIGTFQRLRKLAGLIKSQEIDVVHAFSATSEVFALLATRIARRGRVLFVRRNSGYFHTRSSLWKARFIGRFGAAYVANCEAAKEFTVQHERVAPDRLTVIRNPVCLDRMQEGVDNERTPASLGIQDGESVVGMVATVRPIKDHETFLHAARMVCEEYPRTRFLIVGWQEPKTTSKLQSLLGDLGLRRQVTWTGPIDNPFSVLVHFDVGVLASRSEGFSNALLEYAAAGVATVATDVGGSREIVLEGETGFLVPPGSAKLMADRICRLLGDRGLRDQFGSRARQSVRKRFSEQKILDEYAELYRRLAQSCLG